MVWPLIIASAIGAGAGIYGANQAADAQGDAAKKNEELARENLYVQLGLIEPQRQLGYGAQSDLASLYGYNLTPYQTGDQLMNPGPGASGPIAVGGKHANSSEISRYIGGMDEGKFGGTIDPRAGTVVVDGNPDLSARYTQYLRTGDLSAIGGSAIKKNQKQWRIFSSIEGLRNSGWKYDPAAIEQSNNYSPVGQPTSGKITPPGTATGTSANGTAGNMSRFFTSPDYTFRRDEGGSAIDRGAAARGGALSGNAIRANTELASNLAAGEYGNYVNRLLTMAGLGSAATTTAGTAFNNATGATMASNTQQGDARASGVLGTTNSIINGINGGLNNYYMSRYFSGTNAGTGA